ncbi:headcase protein homolog isoform X2 [Chiloscyllium plagiosum]|uniref:headcase protein homolog isoform X2 n=1 Tax=Chiloscyllium plagiosum TaxID=36176 RepID=UPI001CB8661A|nr:headcase protein homolog isoform X2 [Chiloscyllium plagiosum]
MPNQKNAKGRKNKRTNSSGDEQEAAAGAAALSAGAAGSAAGGAALGQSETGNDHEASCASPLVCSFGRPVELEKDDYQRVVCNNEHCPFGNWMHLQCFYEWESSILVQFNCIGRARSWNEKQCRQNMWTKKGYDLAFRFCSCRCGQGHLKKDVDWYQARRRQDDKKKKVGAKAGEPLPEEGKKCKLNRAPRSHEAQRRHSTDRQNSQEKGAAGVQTPSHKEHFRSPCGSPPEPSPPPPAHPYLSFSAGGPRGSRHLGEFLKTALHGEPCRKLMPSGGGRYSQSELGAAAPRLGALDSPVQFLRRLDLSELLTHVPKHKMNTYHVRMEDDAQVGQGEELRKFILAALSASQRNVVNCALCHKVLPVFELFPLVDGTLFLSPSRHDEIEYDVPCHLQDRWIHLRCLFQEKSPVAFDTLALHCWPWAGSVELEEVLQATALEN